MMPAQTDRGGIRGTILDPTGAVIPRANVAVVNVATGATFRTESTAVGNYNIASLRAGTYQVEVEHPGFKKLVRENVKVNVNGIRALDLKLEVGATTEVITVEAVAPQLKTETSELATNINPQTFLDLPLNASGGRRLADFVALAPGVRGILLSFNVNGGQMLSSQILIDGLDVSGALATPGDTRSLTLPPEALQEFTLVTSNASAQFGNTGGGILSFSVRSGTNALHGNVYEFLRNDKLDTRGFFPAERSINRQHDYGGSVGGPIIIPRLYNGKNRSFFFFNLNRFVVRRAPQSRFISIPSVAFKRGDLSGLRDRTGNLIPIYDPATTRADGMGGFTRDPFPGNIIPEDRFSAISRKAVGFYPDPERSGIVDNFLEKVVNQTNKDNFTIKADHRITSVHNVSVTLNREHNPTVQCSNPCFSPEDVGATSIRDLDFNQSLARATYDWIVSPTVLLHLTAGVNRQGFISNFRHTGFMWAERLGLKGVLGNGPFPTIEMPPFIHLGNRGLGTDDALQGTNLHYTESLSLVRGRHNFKFGAEQRYLRTDHRRPTNSGRFFFSRNETAFPGQIRNPITGALADGRSVTGNSFASFLLGWVDRADHHVQEFAGASRFGYYGAYFQDDIKFTRNFTLNLGIRWDLYLPMYGVHDNYSIMDPSVSNPGAGGLPGAMIFAGFGPGRVGRRRLTPPISWNNYAPRLGLAWSVTPNWVMRAGYGISYFGPASAGTGSIREYNVGFAAEPLVRSTDNGVTPAFLWDDGFPFFVRPPFIDPVTANGGQTSLWDPNASEPAYTQSWHFTVQRQLAPGWLLDAAYVASKGTRLNSGAINANQVHPSFLALGNLLTKPIDDSEVAAAGFRPPYPDFEGSLAQALRPFPQYLFVGTSANLVSIPLLGGAQIGNSTYHSLQLKLEKQFSKGLFLLASYTWSKYITDASSSMGGFFGTTARDHYNRRLAKSLSPGNLPQRLAIAFNYELPIGPGKPFAENATGPVGKLLGGWHLNGVLDYASGDPITVEIANALPLFNDLNLPDVVPGVPQTLDANEPGAQYLNPQAFAVPPPFTFLGTRPGLLASEGSLV